MDEGLTRVPGKGPGGRGIGAAVVLTVILHFGVALYAHLYLTDGWRLPRVVEQPPRWATALLAGAAVALAATCLGTARTIDARTPLADPRRRDVVVSAARAMRAVGAVFLALALWIAATASADLFEVVVIPVSLAFVAALAISAAAARPWLRRLKRDPEFKSEWERLMGGPR